MAVEKQIQNYQNLFELKTRQLQYVRKTKDICTCTCRSYADSGLIRPSRPYSLDNSIVNTGTAQRTYCSLSYKFEHKTTIDYIVMCICFFI